jgi:hypothetical protein
LQHIDNPCFEVVHVEPTSCDSRNIFDITRSTISAKLKLFYIVMVGEGDIYCTGILNLA